MTTTDTLEDDWEILRRDSSEGDFPSTLNMAEAVERVCKAVVDYAILLDKNPYVRKKMIEDDNKFPTFTIIPFYDKTNKKRLWKVSVTYELIDLHHNSQAHDCCERAVEELFNQISKSISAKAQQFDEEAGDHEKDAYEAKDSSRKLRRIGLSMGSYNLIQPNLKLSTEEKST